MIEEKIFSHPLHRTKEERHNKDPVWCRHREEVGRQILAGYPPAIYLFGNAGCGKSTILNCMYNSCVEMGRGVHMYDLPSFELGKPEDFFASIAYHIDEALGIDRGEDPLTSQPRAMYARSLDALRQRKETNGKPPVIIYDRFFPNGRSSDPGYAEVNTIINSTMGEIVQAGAQILAAGRLDLHETYPQLVNVFTQIHMQSQQVR